MIFLINPTRKILNLHAYKIQLLQELKPDDCEKHLNFSVEILNKIDVIITQKCWENSFQRLFRQKGFIIFKSG